MRICLSLIISDSIFLSLLKGFRRLIDTFICTYVCAYCMVKEFGSTVWKQGNSHVVTVPAWFMQAYGVEAGDYLKLRVLEDLQ